MSRIAAYITRLLFGATGHNTLNTPTVPVIFQTSPGVGNDRGIAELEYRVMAGSNVVQTGKTGEDGRIEVRIVGGSVVLELLHNGATVAKYEVKANSAALESDSTIKGVQRRLRMLGYQVGHEGTEQVGVSGDVTKLTDRAILDFQIDQKVAFDGKVEAGTTGKLNDAVNSIP